MIRRGFKRFPALGAGAIAAYGTVRGAQAAGGYVGRKIDELGAKVFKAGAADEARDEAGRWTATQHHLDQANHHAKMARAYISAAPNLSGKKLSDAVDAADMHTTAAAFHAGEAERLHAMAPKMGHLASIVARVARSIRKDWTEWNAEHQKELEQHHADFASGKISMDEANRRIGRLAARANQVSIHEVSAKEPPPRRSPLMARAGRGAVVGAKVGAIAGGLFHGAGAGMAAGPKGALVGGALGAVHGAVAGSLVGTLGGALFGKGSIEQTMGEFKRGKLHSGSKKGPQVTDRAQAIAIALDTARREGLRT
jgi:hypothetical protein